MMLSIFTFCPQGRNAKTSCVLPPPTPRRCQTKTAKGKWDGLCCSTGNPGARRNSTRSSYLLCNCNYRVWKTIIATLLNTSHEFQEYGVLSMHGKVEETATIFKRSESFGLGLPLNSHPAEFSAPPGQSGMPGTHFILSIKLYFYFRDLHSNIALMLEKLRTCACAHAGRGLRPTVEPRTYAITF